MWNTVSGINSMCYWLSRAGNRQHITVTLWWEKMASPCSCVFLPLCSQYTCVEHLHFFLFLSPSNSLSFLSFPSSLPISLLLTCSSFPLNLFFSISLSLSLLVSSPSCTIARPNSDSAAQVAPAGGNWSHASPLCRLTIEKFHYSLPHVSGEMFKREERGKLESKRETAGMFKER